MIMKQLKALLFILFLISSVSVIAQRERNYIYLLDCTKSMTGYNGNPDIWDRTKSYLKTELQKHTPNTTLHVIPFQDYVLNSYNFKAKDLNWGLIEKELNNYVKKITNTSICDAWDATDNYIDPHKDNYIILLTDGQDNVKGRNVLVEKIRKWCGKYENSYAFYVQLTQAAVDTTVANVINMCDNEYVVDARDGIPEFGGLDCVVIYANTLNLKRVHLIGFSSTGKYTAKATSQNPYFDVKIVDNTIENGIVPIQIVARHPISQINSALPEIYNFTFDVKSDQVNITNPKVTVEMTNKPERSLELISEETFIGKATWYNSFMFWDESEFDTLRVDLKAIFNVEAKKDDSSVELLIQDPDGGKDFQLLFNDLQLKDGRITLSSDENTPNVLSVIFNHNARQGTRYLSLKPIAKHELDKINDQPVEQYELSLRSEYEEKWNPLKTILLWLGILIFSALLLWFMLIKRFIYPCIGVRTIQITEPYFSKINVKGKRRVVFSNRNMSQGVLSRIFTGEILYKKNDVWTYPLSFEAGAKKRTIRVMRTKDYAFDPYTSTLKAPNDYVIENINDKTIIKMTIN